MSAFGMRSRAKPSDSRIAVRAASRVISTAVECVAPSTSTISLASRRAKSTTNRSTGCWRRNFQRLSARLRNTRQGLASADVWLRRSVRARGIDLVTARFRQGDCGSGR